MKRLNLDPERSTPNRLSLLRWALLPFLSLGGAVLAAEKTAAQYQRFEAAFESTVSYGNPAQETALTALFTSPRGEKLKVPGFWDGGKIWRVRFLPTETGRWKLDTTSSDAANKGLHQQRSEFTTRRMPLPSRWGNAEEPNGVERATNRPSARIEATIAPVENCQDAFVGPVGKATRSVSASAEDALPFLHGQSCC